MLDWLRQSVFSLIAGLCAVAGDLDRKQVEQQRFAKTAAAQRTFQPLSEQSQSFSSVPLPARMTRLSSEM
jgi:hypothetical protein